MHQTQKAYLLIEFEKSFAELFSVFNILRLQVLLGQSDQLLASGKPPATEPCQLLQCLEIILDRKHNPSIAFHIVEELAPLGQLLCPGLYQFITPML